MRTPSRSLVVLSSALVTLVLAGAPAARATPPQGQVVTVLGRGSLTETANINEKVGGGRVKLQTRGSLDAITQQLTLTPGGTSGWHKHTGPHITIVTQGTLTVIDAKCKSQVLTVGQSTVDSGTEIDKPENLGSTPVVMYITFLVPHGNLIPRVDEPAPKGCTA
jgi:quercetin dioxygenase-like cupin family protein